MFVQAPILTTKSGIRHGFFTRNGGVSTGCFAELNCGGRDTAEPAATVDENRRRVASALGLDPENVLSTQQVHGAHVTIVRTSWSYEQRPQADAMVCKSVGFGLGILTADCVPVVFADAHNRVIGAAHAGWRGASSGILAATIDAMEELGAQRNNICAAIGPAIMQSSYEVDSAFYQRFVAENAANTDFFVAAGTPRQYQFDLPGYVARRLHACGIAEVEHLNLDTYTNESQFYSFRRSTHRKEADYGRQLSVIALT